MNIKKKVLSSSFYIVYCGLFGISKRVESLEFVFNEIQNMKMDPFFFIALKLAEIQSNNKLEYSIENGTNNNNDKKRSNFTQEDEIYQLVDELSAKIALEQQYSQISSNIEVEPKEVKESDTTMQNLFSKNHE